MRYLFASEAPVSYRSLACGPAVAVTDRVGCGADLVSADTGRVANADALAAAARGVVAPMTSHTARLCQGTARTISYRAAPSEMLAGIGLVSRNRSRFTRRVVV